MRGLTRTHEKLLPTEKIFPEFNNEGCSRNIHVYDYRIEIRPDNLLKQADRLDPTLMIEIMIETIDRVDLRSKIVGYVYFPLFLATNLRNSPLDSNVQRYVLNSGCFQLPVYYDRI